MAEEQDAARDRVLAAREDLAEQLRVLEASARAAVDIPTRIRRSPAKAAAVAGSVGFVALKGPQRILGAARRAIFGAPAPMPKSMLPDEVDKTLRSMGDDGVKVRAALERDFADYVRQAVKSRPSLQSTLGASVLRPMITRASKVAADALLTADPEDIARRLASIRDRSGRPSVDTDGGPDTGSPESRSR